MKKKEHNPARYPVRIEWSDDDTGFVATAPDFPGAICVMDTAEEALKEIRLIIDGHMEIMREHGQPIPDPAEEIESVRRLLPVVNVSKLARASGINRNTLVTRLRRGTPMPKAEINRLRAALRRLSAA